jgi:flagellar biosynthetic protein FlhB
MIRVSMAAPCARLPGLLSAIPDTRFPMTLQWFAAEDEGRTEEPSEYKIRKAREEGKVAKSADLASAVVLLFCVIAIAVLGSSMVRTMAEMLRYYLNLSTVSEVNGDARLAAAFFRYFVKLCLPFAGVAVLAAILGNVVQVGFLFTTKPITPDLSRIVPRFGKFIQRSFLSREAAFNLVKSIVKIILIAFIAYINIKNDFDKLASMITAPFLESFRTISVTALKILIESAIALLVFAVVDYLFQRRLHIESLKMSKQEVKEERKMIDGDPLVRSRLRERMRQLLSQNMMQNVPKADVVVTNPTHYAIALEWERERMVAPMVTAKGADNMAMRIREIAAENHVPIMENKPLARALYAEVEIGDVIPEKYYEVMAVILAEVYRMRNEEAVSG